jgi:hypothetical protein
VIGRGFEPRSGQTKDYKIGISCLCLACKEKEKRLLAWNLNNVSVGRSVYLQIVVSVS